MSIQMDSYEGFNIQSYGNGFHGPNEAWFSSGDGINETRWGNSVGTEYAIFNGNGKGGPIRYGYSGIYESYKK